MALPLLALVLLGGPTSAGQTEAVSPPCKPATLVRMDVPTCPGRLADADPDPSPYFDALLDDDDSDDGLASRRREELAVPAVCPHVEPTTFLLPVRERVAGPVRPLIYTLCTLRL
jgi:hypothetical protein